MGLDELKKRGNGSKRKDKKENTKFKKGLRESKFNKNNKKGNKGNYKQPPTQVQIIKVVSDSKSKKRELAEKRKREAERRAREKKMRQKKGEDVTMIVKVSANASEKNIGKAIQQALRPNNNNSPKFGGRNNNSRMFSDNYI